MTIRQTKLADIDKVMAIYEVARQSMRSSGNITQWINGYPSRADVTADIESGDSYVIEHCGDIAGVFSFIVGDEPTYRCIEGKWLNDLPYGTIHRIASGGKAKGIADACLDFCKERVSDIRIDTHADNVPMLRWIAKRGFIYCGVIHVADGSSRYAFQLGSVEECVE